MAKQTHHTAGQRFDRVAFEQRDPVNDGYGNTISGPFLSKFEAYAQISYLRGGETVMAARLKSHSQAIISVLAAEVPDPGVDETWRVRQVEADTLFNIRTITLTPNRAYYEILAETGVNPG